VLLELRIRDLAIIDDLQVGFGPGFNVVSGETGAGKSIILHALGLALGARASADLVRAGASAAHVEATFEPGTEILPILDEQAIDHDPGEPMVLRRVVSAAGRSRSFVNGTSAPAATLRALGVHLVDYASQHESAVLLHEAHHREILDRYAGAEERVAGVADRVRRLRDGEAELARLAESEERRRSDLELLCFQRDELEEAQLEPGEEAAAERELQMLRQAGQLRETVARAERALYSGPGAAVDQVNGALAAVEPLAELDDELQEVHGELQEALYVLEEGARTLTSIVGRVQDDPVRVEELEDRLEDLRALQRKHRTDEEGLLARLGEIGENIASLQGSAERMDDLAGDVEALRRGAREEAEQLSAERRDGARRLAARAAEALAELAMDGATFEVAVEPDPAGLTETGCDGVVFRLSANPGEPARPLAKVASGGELSRVLLALKEVLQDRGYAGSFVLDEIDTGIGGATADVVGRKLEGLAGQRQLIVITHLPQIAARATTHLKVGKTERDGRTTVWAEDLSDEARVDEVARMVAGERHADRSRALAGEMIEGSSLRLGSDPVVE